MSGDFLQGAFDGWRREQGRRLEALERMEAEILRLRGVVEAQLFGKSEQFGPYSVSGKSVVVGSPVFIIRGSAHAADNSGEWKGQHALGVVVRAEPGAVWVIFVGSARVRVTHDAGKDMLQAGARLFLSRSAGMLSKGWPQSGQHVYPVANVVGQHSGHTVDAFVLPQTGMRFGR